MYVDCLLTQVHPTEPAVTVGGAHPDEDCYTGLRVGSSYPKRSQDICYQVHAARHPRPDETSERPKGSAYICLRMNMPLMWISYAATE